MGFSLSSFWQLFCFSQFLFFWKSKIALEQIVRFASFCNLMQIVQNHRFCKSVPLAHLGAKGANHRFAIASVLVTFAFLQFANLQKFAAYCNFCNFAIVANRDFLHEARGCGEKSYDFSAQGFALSISLLREAQNFTKQGVYHYYRW